MLLAVLAEALLGVFIGVFLGVLFGVCLGVILEIFLAVFLMMPREDLSGFSGFPDLGGMAVKQQMRLCAVARRWLLLKLASKKSAEHALIFSRYQYDVSDIKNLADLYAPIFVECIYLVKVSRLSEGYLGRYGHSPYSKFLLPSKWRVEAASNTLVSTSLVITTL